MKKYNFFIFAACDRTTDKRKITDKSLIRVENY